LERLRYKVKNLLHGKSNLQIYGSHAKSFVIRDDDLWLSYKKYKNLEKFEGKFEMKGIRRNALSFPLSSISTISFNEASDSVTIKHKFIKNEDKKFKMDLGDKKLSKQFGHFLGHKLNMTKSQNQESKW
jgi:hypothetical protein